MRRRVAVLVTTLGVGFLMALGSCGVAGEANIATNGLADAAKQSEREAPVVLSCPDAAATVIYVISRSSKLYAFDPATSAFTFIGRFSCPDAVQGPHHEAFPTSMAVDRDGLAYVAFGYSSCFPGSCWTGELYRMSLATADCRSTDYYGYGFHMAFVPKGNDGGGEGGESLFISEDSVSAGGVKFGSELGTVDPKTLAVKGLRAYGPALVWPSITGTPDGRLFAFYADPEQDEPGPSTLAQIDPSTAKVITADAINSISPCDGPGWWCQAWPFAFWGGDFYIFDSLTGSTNVHRYHPSAERTTVVATLAHEDILGAAVASCAPKD